MDLISTGIERATRPRSPRSQGSQSPSNSISRQFSWTSPPLSDHGSSRVLRFGSGALETPTAAETRHVRAISEDALSTTGSAATTFRRKSIQEKFQSADNVAVNDRVQRAVGAGIFGMATEGHDTKRRSGLVALPEELDPLVRGPTLAQTLCWACYAMHMLVENTAVWYFRTKNVQYCSILLTVISCVTYVVNTYIPGDPLWLFVLEIIYLVLFSIDFFLTALLYPSPLQFAVTFTGAADLLSILPSFGIFHAPLFNLGFLRFLRLAKGFRILRLYQYSSSGPGSMTSEDEVKIKSVLLGLKLFGLIFTVTAIVYAVEEGSSNAFDEPLQWHDALYFTIVTLTTVGYGDITPTSTFSRLFMVVVITGSFILIPLEVSKLVAAVSMRPKHRRPFRHHGQNLHVVIALSGDDSSVCFDEQVLHRMLEELFHEDHGTDNTHLWAVLMANSAPTLGVRNILNTPRFKLRTQYYRGHLQDPKDLDAVKAEYADAIFVVMPKNVVSSPGENLQQATNTATLAALSLQRYLRRAHRDKRVEDAVKAMSTTQNPCRAIISMPDACHGSVLQGFGVDTIISQVHLKMSMMAYGTLCPAFLPFITSSLRSTEHVHPDSGSGTEGWLSSYFDGTSFEVYAVEVPPIHTLFSFKWALEFLYEHSDGEVVLLGKCDKTGSQTKSCGVASIQGMSSLNSPGRCVEIFPDLINLDYAITFFLLTPGKKEADQAIASLIRELHCRKREEGRNDAAAAPPRPVSALTDAESVLGREAEEAPDGAALNDHLAHRRSSSLISRGIFRAQSVRTVATVATADVPAEIERASDRALEKEAKDRVFSVVESLKITLAGLAPDEFSRNPRIYVSAVHNASRQLACVMCEHVRSVPVGISGHVVLVVHDLSVKYYIQLIRRLDPAIQLVVITGKDELFNDLMAALEELKVEDPALDTSRIYSVLGATNSRSAMQAAHCQHAKVVSLFADPCTDGDESVLLSCYALERIMKEMRFQCRVMVDLKDDKSIYFLKHRANFLDNDAFFKFDASQSGSFAGLSDLFARNVSASTSDIFSWPLFASGSVWSSSIIDVLAAQTYFHPDILTFVEFLCALSAPTAFPEDSVSQREGVSLTHEAKFRDSDQGGEAAQRRYGVFHQAKLTGKRFKCETYGELASYLFSQHCVPIGLYRPAGHKGAPQPYNHINPPRQEELIYKELDAGKFYTSSCHFDSVVVLCGCNCSIGDEV